MVDYCNYQSDHICPPAVLPFENLLFSTLGLEDLLTSWLVSSSSVIYVDGSVPDALL